jgi:hypothetical protein
MAPKPKLGIDASGLVLLKYVHPSQYVRDRYPNMLPQQKLENCIVTGKEPRRIRGNMQDAVIFRHDDFPDKELYCVIRWFKVTEEGPADKVFAAEGVAVVETVLEDDTIDETIQRMANLNVTPDTAEFRSTGAIDIDDDNAPAPENIPNVNDPMGNASCMREWDHDGTCYRRIKGPTHFNAKLQNVTLAGDTPTLLNIFKCLFFTSYVKEVMIPEMNKGLDKPVMYGEFLLFLGLWLLMCTTHFEQRRDFFNKRGAFTPFDKVPFYLGDYMTGYRFEQLVSALRYTNNKPPSYLDKFWEVRDMIMAWNENMKKISCHRGYVVWTNQCQSGYPSSHVPDSCVCQGSHGLLVMSITPFAVVRARYYSEWSW